MKLGLILTVLGASATLGACGDDGNTTPTGPCRDPLGMAWPSDDDPQVCAHTIDPQYPTQRTQCGDIKEDCDDTGRLEPNLDCLTTPREEPADPATVTLVGFADVFSNGRSSQNARIELYREADIGSSVTDLADVSSIASVDLVLDATTVMTARACPKENDMPEALRGECVIPDTDCTGCDVAVDAVDFCYQTQCHPLQRWEVEYQIPDVPTNTPLVVRTIGVTAGEIDPQHETWAPVVQYNAYLSTADRACELDPYFSDANSLDQSGGLPRYRFNANLLSRSDYETIPVTSGLSSGVAAGHGAVAGEIHDCDDIRIEHAQIGYDPVPLRPIYFNENPAKTLPDLSRIDRGTSKMALYSGLDLEPGPLRVVALGHVGGATVSLGEFTGRIWPDTVTIIGINGGKPVQAP